AVFQFAPRTRPGRREELAGEERRRLVVQCDQRLALDGAGAFLDAARRLRNLQARALRQKPDSFGERQFLLQLDEADDIAAGAATEAFEETLVPIDVEGGRLLLMKRTESLPCRAGLFERYDIAHDRHD